MCAWDDECPVGSRTWTEKKTRPCLTDYEVMSCLDGSVCLERRFYAESYATDGRHEMNAIN